MASPRKLVVPESPLFGSPGDHVAFSLKDVAAEEDFKAGGGNCRFGDDDNVPCSMDMSNSTIRCRVPKKRKSQKTPILISPLNGKFEEEFEFEYEDNDTSGNAHSLCDNLSVSFLRTRNKVGKEVYDKVDAAPLWFWAFIAEFLGTMFLVFFGTGVVASAVLTGAQAGIWQVAVVWGIGVSLSIYATADVSGAHLNPAVSICLCIFRSRGFNWRILPIYLVAQFLGSFIGGFLIYATFYPLINQYEDFHGIERGSCESVQTAQFFGEYFPNPGGAGSWYGQTSDEYAFCTSAVRDGDVISPGHCLWLETLSTAILMFVILSVTDPYNTALSPTMAPLLIGLTVAMNISIFSCIQLGMNPARDFGPRLAALCLGWGSVAIPGPQGGFWTYIFGPIFGAFLGAMVHDLLFPREVVKNAKDRDGVDASEAVIDTP